MNERKRICLAHGIWMLCYRVLKYKGGADAYSLSSSFGAIIIHTFFFTPAIHKRWILEWLVPLFTSNKNELLQFARIWRGKEFFWPIILFVTAKILRLFKKKWQIFFSDGKGGEKNKNKKLVFRVWKGVRGEEKRFPTFF